MKLKKIHIVCIVIIGVALVSGCGAEANTPAANVPAQVEDPTTTMQEQTAPTAIQEEIAPIEPTPTETTLPTPTTAFDPEKIYFGSGYNTGFPISNSGEEAVTSVIFSPESSMLAMAGFGEISIIGTRALGKEHLLEGHEDIVWDMVWTADGKILGSASQDGTVIIWETDNFTQAGILDTGAALSIDASPNSEYFAVGTEAGEVQIWEIASQTRLETFVSPTASIVNTVRWSPEGSLITSGEETGQIYMWDFESGELLNNLLPPMVEPSSTNTLDWSMDGKSLASGYQNGDIYIWDTTSWEIIHAIQTEIGWLSSVDFLPNKPILAATGEDFHTSLWNTETGEKILSLMNFCYGYCAAWSPNGKYLAVGIQASSLCAFPDPDQKIFGQVRLHSRKDNQE